MAFISFTVLSTSGAKHSSATWAHTHTRVQAKTHQSSACVVVAVCGGSAHQDPGSFGDQLGRGRQFRQVHARQQPVDPRVAAHPLAEAAHEGERMLQTGTFELWKPFDSLYRKKKKSARETNLFVKVGIEYDQVEVTLQALNGSMEEVIFGTASLQNIQKVAPFLFLDSRSKLSHAAYLNLIILSNPFQFTLVLIYCFFYVVHLRTQSDSLVNLKEKK